MCIGSFLNVVAYRVPNRESVVYPPSHCTHCNHRLTAADLVPVFSYLFLRGRCRYCHQRISAQYAIGEAVTGALFVIIVRNLGLQPELAVGLLFVSILMASLLADLRYMLIPNKIVFFGIASACVLRLWIHELPLWHYAAGFLVGGGILYAIAIVSNGGMGGGDVKLFAFIGLTLGWKLVLLAVFLSCLTGTLYGLFLIVMRKFERKKAVPFAPFIAAGSLLAYLWGNDWIQVYLNYFQK